MHVQMGKSGYEEVEERKGDPSSSKHKFKQWPRGGMYNDTVGGDTLFMKKGLKLEDEVRKSDQEPALRAVSRKGATKQK